MYCIYLMKMLAFVGILDLWYEILVEQFSLHMCTVLLITAFPPVLAFLLSRVDRIELQFMKTQTHSVSVT